MTKCLPDDEAVALANDTIYGLGAALWTRDINTALRVARKLRAGQVWVNSYDAADCTVPGAESKGPAIALIYRGIFTRPGSRTNEYTNITTLLPDLVGADGDQQVFLRLVNIGRAFNCSSLLFAHPHNG